MREKFGTTSFSVLIQGDEPVYPAWQPNALQAKRMVPGSNVLVRQLMGFAPASITLRIVLDSHRDYMALQANIGRTSTLVLRSRFTNARGTTEFHDGEQWENLNNTTLDALGAPRFEIDGSVEVLATFERAFNPGNGRAA